MKKILIISLILILLVSGGLVYLNKVFLPTAIRAIIVDGLKQRTQSEITLEALSFSLLKGLTLRNLVVADKQGQLLKIKEASCGFLILPIFKKALIIPAVNIDSADIFLQRRKDGSFNLQDLFAEKPAPGGRPGFNIFVRRLTLRDSIVRFSDETLSQPFSKNIEDINLNLYLSLPDKIRFNLDAEAAGAPKLKIKASGDYGIIKKEMSVKIHLRDLIPKDFALYYGDAGFSIPDGRVDGSIDIHYNAQTGRLAYSGKAALIGLSLEGVKFAGRISDINAEVTFDNAGLSSQGLSARVFSAPVRANLHIADFANPLINAQVSSKLDLALLQSAARDKLKSDIIEEAAGEADLYLDLQARPGSEAPLQLNGYLEVIGASLKLQKFPHPFKDITGRIEFSPDTLSWPVLNFTYLDAPYSSSGALSNFKSPAAKFSLLSKAFVLESDFTITDKVIRLSRFAGQYLDSPFSITGDIDTGKPPALSANLEGRFDLDLNDLKEIFKESGAKIEALKPSGVVRAKFNLAGDIKEIKSCTITGQASASSLSAYGFKIDKLSLDYQQANGLASIAPLSALLYDGILKANAQAQLYPQGLPFQIEASLENLKLEKLKTDTPLKADDTAGTIAAEARLSGELKDISKLNGAGRILISEGKLWQLSLFKGLGSLVFVKDLGNIVFHKGGCSFTVADKNISTGDILLEGDIAQLSGALKLGFDGAVNGLLNIKVLDENVPLTGTFRDATTAIIGQGGMLGAIEIRGTLKKPEYKFRVSVVEIIKGIRETFFKKND